MPAIYDAEHWIGIEIAGRGYIVPLSSNPNAFQVLDYLGRETTVTIDVAAELFSTARAWWTLRRICESGALEGLSDGWQSVNSAAIAVVALETIRDLIEPISTAILTGNTSAVPRSLLVIAAENGVNAVAIAVVSAVLANAEQMLESGIQSYNNLLSTARSGSFIDRYSVAEALGEISSALRLGNFAVGVSTEIGNFERSWIDDLIDVGASVVGGLSNQIGQGLQAGGSPLLNTTAEVREVVSHIENIADVWTLTQRSADNLVFDWQPLTENGISVSRALIRSSRYVTLEGSPPAVIPTPVQPSSRPVQVDDFENSTSTTGRVQVGGYVTGVIERQGDNDWFAVTLQSGQYYNFSMTGGSVGGFSTLSSPHLYLRDASGNLLADASPVSINSVFTYRAASTGTYYVNAGAHGNSAVGGYALAVSPGSAPTSPGGNGGTSARPLRLDLDSVDSRGEEDGASLVFRVEYSGDLTRDIDIQWEVRGVGPHATDAQDFVRSSGSVTLQEGRDYVYIRLTPINDRVDESDETFELVIRGPGGVSISDDAATGVILNDDAGRILPGADELNSSFSRATVMERDQSYRGFINTPGDIDYFAAVLRAGETYDLNVSGNDDNILDPADLTNYTRLGDPQATLYDANFNQLVGSFNAPINSSRISHQFTPTQTGVYYIAVREDGGNDVGQYFIEADIRVPADDFVASVATAGRLIEGSLVLANNERANDHDWFAVDLVAGATYSFYAMDQDVSRSGSNYVWPGWIDNLIVKLRDASGNVVAEAVRNPAFSNGGDVPAQVTFTALTAGRYFVSVEGNDGSWRYLAGYDRIHSTPSDFTTVQPGTEGVDVTFAEVRDHSAALGVNDGTLGVGGFSGSGSSGSALRFNIDTLPDEAGYAAIELYFTGAQMGSLSNVAAIAMMLGIPPGSWDEASSLGQLGQVEFQSILPPPGAIGWYRVEITDLYNAWQSGQQSNNGIVLMPVNMHTPRNLFHSSDALDAALRPRLIVQQRIAEDIRGTADADGLYGTDMADRLFGLDGDDVLTGERGADFIDGGAGADLIDGGEGFDTVSYSSSTSAVRIHLGQGRADGGFAAGDSLINIERVDGSIYADSLIGGLFSETFVGNAGDDILTGGGGADILTGGDGRDSFRLTSITDSDEMGSDNITDFTTGEDRLDLTALATTSISLIRHNGSTLLFGMAEGGAFSLAALNRELNASDIDFGAGHGVFVIGSDAADSILGSSRADPLVGNGGNDIITGGAGADAIAGGAGRDVYRYLTRGDSNQETGFDNLYDFTSGEDRIDLAAIGATSISILRADNGSSFIFAETAQGGFLTTAANRTVQATDITYSNGFGIYLIGSGVDDILIGTSLGDPIAGGAGNDTITGGGGVDAMFGDAGADTFIYLAASDSTVAAADGIFGFVSGLDKLDLTRVRTGAADTFGIAYISGGSYLFVDLGGNGTNDMVIGLAGTTLVTSDIVWGTGAIGEEAPVKDTGPEVLPGEFDVADLLNGDAAFDLTLHPGRFMLDLDPNVGRGFYHGQDWYL